MAVSACLHQYLIESARRIPHATAAVEPGRGSITYAELDGLSDKLSARLAALGVRKGDRIGIYLRKSIDALVTIYGILKTGGVYVPVDVNAPATRGAYILHDCDVKFIIIDASRKQSLFAELDKLGPVPPTLAIEAEAGITAALGAAESESDLPIKGVSIDADDLAYILYTSGSTGRPKGVMLTHENAVSFVDWCSNIFQPQASDRFSSHAPFHFDLSILDIHVCVKHGATLVLISEGTGKDAPRLAQLIADEKISIWYSTPSILSLLTQFGQLAKYDHSSLRLVLFAGEVFPIKHLRALCELWPAPQYFNLYGPTETNVCTYFEVKTPIPSERTVPYPIGYTCSHLRSRVVDEHGRDVPRGGEGELCIAGAGVMQGYWSLPEQTAKSFYRDPEGTYWYRTGDVVTESEDGCYAYLGRRDRMIKRRGYRVELGEIEVCLYLHPSVKEAAVVAVPDEESGVSISAFLSCHGSEHPSLIAIKRFCAERLPLYMVPDSFTWQESLPKTSTDKIDYQRLKEMR